MGLDDTVTARTVSPPAPRGRFARAEEPAAIPTAPHPPLRIQLLRFAVVGVLNTGLSLLIYKIAVDLGVAYPAASVGAFGVGALNSYTLNRIWTFRAGSFSRLGFARYLAVQLIGLGVNEIVLVSVVEGLSGDWLLAQALALGVASSIMFVLNRHWAFAHRHGA